MTKPLSISITLCLTALVSQAQEERRPVDAIKDLQTPEVTDEEPAAGKRVRLQLPKYEGSGVYHALYLPTDWKEGEIYPVMVEFAGNKWKTGPGTVEASNLGYGISGGEGMIWVCVPYVNTREMINQVTWWGDVDATVEYCKTVVKQVCEGYGGDPDAVVIAGFSRGAIACNYIGLHDDEIASLWKGFICHSHYDGVRSWGYAKSDKVSARERLGRLRGRPQYISHENSVEASRGYLAEAMPDGNFTFQALKGWGHTDAWVLYDIPERKALRKWLKTVIEGP
tara:strand:- start:309 stop:1154 length:846 start_codon:yes stop_codon:yes gene_type:complete